MWTSNRAALALGLLFIGATAYAAGLSGSVSPQVGGGIGGFDGGINSSGSFHGAAPVLTSFNVTAPASATTGVAFNFTVSARNQSGGLFPGYAGTVHFTTTDGAGTVPINSTLTSGIGVFSATLNTVGTWTLTATDTVTLTLTGTSGPIVVSPPVVTGCNGTIDLSSGCTFPVGMGMILL